MAWETRWRDTIFAAALPADADLQDFWPRFAAAAPWTLALGLRAAVWLLWLCPPALGLGPRSFGQLTLAERHRVLERCAESPLFLPRQLAEIIKVVASFGYFSSADVRARFASAAP